MAKLLLTWIPILFCGQLRRYKICMIDLLHPVALGTVLWREVVIVQQNRCRKKKIRFVRGRCWVGVGVGYREHGTVMNYNKTSLWFRSKLISCIFLSHRTKIEYTEIIGVSRCYIDGTLIDTVKYWRWSSTETVRCLRLGLTLGCARLEIMKMPRSGVNINVVLDNGCNGECDFLYSAASLHRRFSDRVGYTMRILWNHIPLISD